MTEMTSRSSFFRTESHTFSYFIHDSLTPLVLKLCADS